MSWNYYSLLDLETVCQGMIFRKVQGVKFIRESRLDVKSVNLGSDLVVPAEFVLDLFERLGRYSLAKVLDIFNAGDFFILSSGLPSCLLLEVDDSSGKSSVDKDNCSSVEERLEESAGDELSCWILVRVGTDNAFVVFDSFNGIWNRTGCWGWAVCVDITDTLTGLILKDSLDVSGLGKVMLFEDWKLLGLLFILLTESRLMLFKGISIGLLLCSGVFLDWSSSASP